MLLAGFAMAVLCCAQEPAASPAIRTSEGVSPAPFRGAGSCSAVACHGSIKAFDRSISSVKRNEHTTWISSDKHSRAYQVLFDERSERIERNLAGRARIHESIRRCAVPRVPHGAPARRPFADDGLAQLGRCRLRVLPWPFRPLSGTHTTSGWKTKSRDEKEDHWGLWNTKDLTRRSSVCVGCHVGEHSGGGLSVRDVNHDLIAAGHPRLNFEFSASLENMPSHWNEKDENAGSVGQSGQAANFPARAWSIGRLTTIKAALALLEKRVTEAEDLPEPLADRGSGAGKRAARWPEFTEFGCFSCHHDLRDQAWRRAPRADGRAIGSPRWGTWISPGSEELLATLLAGQNAQAATNPLTQVAIAMEKPDSLPRIRAAVEVASRSLKTSLDQVAAHPFDVATIERLIDRLDSPQAWDDVASWDEAAQRYLALVPLYQSWLALAPNRTPKQEALRKRLAELLDLLKFPKGFDSPRGFEVGRFPSQER